MNNILDSEERIVIDSYAMKSYRNFVYSACIFLLFLLGVAIEVIFEMQSNFLLLIMGMPIVALLPLSLIGFVRGIKSFIKKEPETNKKVIGLIGNFMIILLFLYLIVANVMDIMAVLQ